MCTHCRFHVHHGHPPRCTRKIEDENCGGTFHQSFKCMISACGYNYFEHEKVNDNCPLYHDHPPNSVCPVCHTAYSTEVHRECPKKHRHHKQKCRDCKTDYEANFYTPGICPCCLGTQDQRPPPPRAHQVMQGNTTEWVLPAGRR